MQTTNTAHHTILDFLSSTGARRSQAVRAFVNDGPIVDWTPKDRPLYRLPSGGRACIETAARRHIEAAGGSSDDVTAFFAAY